MKKETVIYRGLRFTRYPESKSENRRNYFTCTTDVGRRGHRPDLHVFIWESINGPRPEGCAVHHKDHNPLNNNPENLVLMRESDHFKYHRDSACYGEATCVHCQTLFIKKYKQKHIYCSPLCRGRAQSLRNMPAYRARKKARESAES